MLLFKFLFDLFIGKVCVVLWSGEVVVVERTD